TLLTHLLDPGDLLVAPHDCYGGTYRLFEHLAAKGHFRVSFVDQTDPAALQAAFARGPRMILVETPSNPLLRIVDIAAVSALARAHGTLLAVDNTFLSPILQQPIRLGADIVLHSTTKYLNGHSDVVGGAIVAATGDIADSLAWWANCLGVTGAPFDSYLTLRGIRTLHARMRQHEESANRVAAFLDAHPIVSRVYYPGLASHPGHRIAKSQQSGFGGMVSVEISGGEGAVAIFVERLQHFSLAESLGGVESLVCHPATMTHAAVNRDALQKAGIGDSLIRLSIGLEDTDDLLQDLQQALDVASHAVTLKSVTAASC
ncbi:MAG TPA: PLP-dependent transferase, partial [Woeseiaceae bacterium]|nr:PLP-dependent transferase [Woeseiaceae bacterium]